MANGAEEVKVNEGDVIFRTMTDGPDRGDPMIDAIKGNVFKVVKATPHNVEIQSDARTISLPESFLTNQYLENMTGSILQLKKGDLLMRTQQDSPDAAFNGIKGEVFTVKEINEGHIIVEIASRHMSVPIKYLRKHLFEVLSNKSEK